MSSTHNNARRHRQLIKKRVNELNVNEIGEKRSPPPDRIGNPPPPSNPQALPTIGDDPSNSDTPGGGANNPRPTDTRTPPGRPNPTQTQRPTQTDTVPQVPTNTRAPNTLSSSSTATTTSTTQSSLTPTTTARAQTTVSTPTPTQVSTPTFTPQSITSGLGNTASFDPTPSATNTADSDSSLSTSSIVGIVAASLVAVAAVVVVGMWLTKRYFKKKGEDEFNRNSFIRQSVHIPDGEDDYRSPRPPTMIERHRGAHSPSYAGYGNGNYPVPPMPSFNPGEMMMNNAPPANPFSMGPGDHYGDQYGNFGAQPALVRVPSNGSGHGYNGGNNMHTGYQADAQGQYQQYPTQNQNLAADEHHHPPTQGPGQGYADLQRSSVTPYQAAQYAEISRQLNIPSVGNSPISPAHPNGNPVYGQEFGQQQHLAIDAGRLPTPAPPRVLSPAMSPQRTMSPTVAGGNGYSFPSPLGTTQPNHAPASVAHAAAMAALGVPAHAQPQSANVEGSPQHNDGAKRPNTVYEENDAYGGM